MEIFFVGGFVRDSLMGVKSKDIDFVFISNKGEVDAAYDEMAEFILARGGEIFPIPNARANFTIRARMPIYGAVDFVLARKEISYIPGTRYPVLSVGTLQDDLVRRDFTVNAIARTENGAYIDPFGGIKAIQDKILDTPTFPERTFEDDPLRILRMIRFEVKLGFTVAERVRTALENPELPELIKQKVSAERVRDELERAFAVDSLATFNALNALPREILKVFLSGGVRLSATMRA